MLQGHMERGLFLWLDRETASWLLRGWLDNMAPKVLKHGALEAELGWGRLSFQGTGSVCESLCGSLRSLDSARPVLWTWWP